MSDSIDSQSISDSQYKFMPCRYCGEMMKVGMRKKRAPAHVECGISIAAECQQQMAAKSGPYYDRWLMAQAAAIEKARGGGGPPVNS